VNPGESISQRIKTKRMKAQDSSNESIRLKSDTCKSQDGGLRRRSLTYQRQPEP
jgi:hypothetical protein